MYLRKSNFIFPCSAPTNGQERTRKKHMLKYICFPTQPSITTPSTSP